MAAELDAAKVREAVEKLRRFRGGNEALTALDIVCTAALDSLTQRELVGEQERELEDCIRDNHQLEREQDGLLRERDQLRSELSEVEHQRAVAAEIAKNAGAIADRLRSELEAAHRIAKHYVEQVAYLSEELNKATAGKQELQRELEAERQTGSRLCDDYARIAGECITLRTELEAARAERDENEGVFKVWRRRCQEAEAQLEAARAERDEALQGREGELAKHLRAVITQFGFMADTREDCEVIDAAEAALAGEEGE